MRKIRETIGRLAAGGLRWAALAVAIGLAGSAWAADAPTISIDGTTVTINNETASSYDSSKTLQVTDTWQTKGFWLPTGTGLASGTMVKVKSIAFAVPSTGNFVDKIGLVGCVSASAVRTTGGFTTANADKVLFSFEDSQCYLRAGYSSQIWFLDSTGAKVSTSTVLNFTLGGNSNQYIDNLGWTISNVFHTPVIEVVGEIMTGSYITGAQTAIGNSGTDPVYASEVTGWLDTENNKTGPMVLVGSNAGTYSIGVNNANSVNAAGRHSTWSKLSGSGTLGTVNGQSTGTTPVLEVYDASEFTGSIITANGGPRLSVVFGTSDDCASLRSSYNSWFNGGSYLTSFYVAEHGAVTIPAGKTWQASKLVVKGDATINGTFNGQIVKLDGGTITINSGATISGGLGSTRNFTGWTVDSSIPAKITMTAEEYGKGSVSVTGASGISSITVLAPDGTTTVGTITPEAGAGTLNTGIKTSGLATWCDYEFNGDKSNSGKDTTGLESDVNTTTYPEIFNNQMLYTYTHPWRNISYPNSWTAVVRCTVPELENAVVVMFGTYGAGAIGLVAGPNPEEEMLLVSTPGNTATTSEAKHFTTLATMSVKDATTAQHVYVFTKNGTTVNVYCDGDNVLSNYELPSATLGGGLQVGSLHGGVTYNNIDTGLVRFGAGESQISSLTVAQQQNARIDCMRMYDYIVSPEQVAALSVEFPAVKLYRATVADGATTDWGLLTWTPAWDGGNTQSKVLLTTEGDATVALPESITVDEVQLDLAADSTLTLVGPGSFAVTQPVTIGNGTLKLTGTVTLAQDLALNGSVVFDSFTAAGTGSLNLADGATVGVASGSVVVTGSYTLAEGTVVDSVYTGDGVKLIPLTSAVASITQGGTTLYYSSVQSAFSALMASTDEAVVFTLLTGDVDAETATTLQGANYYVSGNTVTKAVAKIVTTTYATLAAAVAAAEDNATVTLLRASSEAITLNKAITLSETANFSGTLTGNGTLTFAAFRNNPSITFSSWTGKVVLPSFAADGTILNKYGVTGSTVVLKGITGGWLGETDTTNHRMDVLPALQLDGDVTITGFSTAWTYMFVEITGTGTFSLDPADNHPKAASITKVAEGFSGSIYSDVNTTLTIGTLAREAGTSTAQGTKLLSVTGDGDVEASALTIGGESSDVGFITKDDGIYVVTYVTITIPEVTGAVATAVVGETPVEIVNGEGSVREDATVTVTYAAAAGWELVGQTEYTIDVANNETTFTLDESTVATQYVASVPVNDVPTSFTTLAGAIAAASSDAENPSTVTLLTDCSEAVTLDKTIVFVENGFAFSGTLTGAGTIIVETAPSATTWAAARFVVDGWTGTFVVGWDMSGKMMPDKYGITGSTVEVATEVKNGYFNIDSEDLAAPSIAPALYFDKDVTISDGFGGSNNATTFAKVGMAANKTFATRGNATSGRDSYYTFTELNGFDGTLSVRANDHVTIGAVKTVGMPAANTVIVACTKTTGEILNGDGNDASVYPVDVTTSVEFDNQVHEVPGKAVYATIGNASGLYYAVANIGDKYYATYAAAVADYTAGDTIVVSDATAGNVPTGWELTSNGTRLTKIQVPITWDVDGVQTVTYVDYGDTPSYAGETPTRTATAQYTYAFTGWTPAFDAVTEATTYVAQFTPVTRQYTLTVPEVENATATVTVGGVPTDERTFNYGTVVTVTWTATSSAWKVTSDPQVINLTGDVTAEEPTVAPNEKTFTVVVPDNMTVTVDGEPYTANTEITRTIGTSVTIVYTVAGQFVGSNYEQTVEVKGDTVSIPTPGNYVAPVPAVAEVGGVYKATLADAIAAVEDGGTVTMLASHNVGTARIQVSGKSFTVVLNGKTLSSSEEDAIIFRVSNGKTITIDGTVEGSKLSGSVMIAGGTEGHIVANGGTYENDLYCPFYANGTCSDASTISIAGATIVANDTDPADSDAETGFGLYQAGPATVTITDTEITAVKTGVEVRAGSLTIGDTVITANGDPSTATANGNGGTVVGAAIAVSPHNTNKPIELTVNSGTFTGVKAVYENYLENKARTATTSIALNGGTFIGDIEIVEDIGTVIPANSAAKFSDATADGLAENTYLAYDSVSELYQVVAVTLDPASLELYPNCSNYVYVVGAPAGSTYRFTFAGNVGSGGYSSAQGWGKPYGKQPGSGTVTAIVSNNNEQVAMLVADVTVKDVVAVVGGTEYATAEWNDAVSAAIENEQVLEVYYKVANITLAEGQTLRWKAADNRGQGSVTALAPAATENAMYKVVKTTQDGVTTATCVNDGAPNVMITKADSTVSYSATLTPTTANATYKLLRSFTKSGSNINASAAGVVLDLNGQTLTLDDSFIYVRNLTKAASLTVRDTSANGTGAIVCNRGQMFWADASDAVTIEGGTFTGTTALVYTTSGGTATVEGGTFAMTGTDKKFLFNCEDSNRGTITVAGGTFEGFDPAVSNDGDMVATGKISIPAAQEDWYTVVDAVAITLNPPTGLKIDGVTADGVAVAGDNGVYTVGAGQQVAITWSADGQYIVTANTGTASFTATTDAVFGETAGYDFPEISGAVAKIGDTPYATLAEAFAAVSGATGEVTVELLANAALELSRNGNVLGGEAVTKITINGNGNTLNVVRNGTWAQFNTANNAALVLNDVSLTSEFTGTQTGWVNDYLQNPNHNIAFNCAVELNNVTSSTALSFFKDAALDTVTIAETVDVYSIWIHTTASTVSIKDLVVDSPTGRGIKVDDSFVAGWGGTPSATSISINGATFTTKDRKAAVLVRSTCATTVAASGTIDISGVPADTTNLVWVDEAAAAGYTLVTVTGATKAVEPSNYVATLSGGNGVKGYYTTVTAALEAAEDGDTVVVIADTHERVYAAVNNNVTLDINGKTMTSPVDDVIIQNGTGTLTIQDTAETLGLVQSTINGVDLGVAVWARQGTVVVKSGVFENNSNYEATLYVSNGAYARVEGGTFRNVAEGTYHWKQTWAPVNFNIQNGHADKANALVVTGGTFSADPGTGDDSLNGEGTYCAVGYIPTYDAVSGTYGVKEGSYVAEVNGQGYETLQEALDAISGATGEVTVELLANATLEISKTGNVLGGDAVTKITISGNNKTLNVVRNGTWAQFNTANNAKLVLNGVNLTSEFTGTQTGWVNDYLQNPNHNIAFNCAVELNNVTSSTALSFFKDAALDTVTIAETVDVYSIWIHTTASTVSIKDLVVDSPTGRGIKVDDSFVAGWGGTPSATSISINGATFTTKDRKAAVLVRSTCATTVAASGTIDISGVPADTTNLVWVDEASATKFDLVTVTGATVAVEPGGYVATVSAGNAVKGYYTTVTAALEAAATGDTVVVIADTCERVYATVNNNVTLDINGKTMTSPVDDVIIQNGTGTLTIQDTAETLGLVQSTINGVDLGVAVWARQGTVVVKSGVFENNSNYEATLYVSNGAYARVEGGTFRNVAEGTYNWKKTWAPVNFNIQNGHADKANALVVTGGTFSADPGTGDDSLNGEGTFCATGYEPKDNGDGTYGVQTKKVEVETDEDDPTPTADEPVTVLVAVPKACTAATLIDVENRAEGDILKAYVKDDECFYTWELDSTKAWQPKETYKVDESGATVSSKPAVEVALVAGQSVWVTIKTDETIKLLVTYNPEPVAVEVDTGWNMVAPTTPGGTTVKEIAETSGATVEDAIVVPTQAAPKVYTKDETTGEWGFADIKEVVVETVTGTKKRAIPFHNTEDTTIKAGKGVWFVNGGNTKEINL